MSRVEARAYGPNCSEPERQALRHRVRRIADDVILYEEVPVLSTFQIELMFDQLGEVSAGLDRFFYVIDLSEGGRPSAEQRELLKNHFQRFHRRMVHTSVFTGRNFMLNVAIRFVFNGFGFESYSVDRTREQAMARIDRIRFEHRA